jgi:hypothetical protein
VLRPRIGRPLLLALCLTACGDGGAEVTGPGLNVSGTYEGPQTFSAPPGVTARLKLTLVDGGGLVNGSFSQSTGDFGSVTGNVSGTILRVESRSTVSGITCVFDAGISNEGATISGAFVCASQEAGSFTVNRT